MTLLFALAILKIRLPLSIVWSLLWGIYLMWPMHDMCRSTKKTSEKASTGPQKSQNDRLFATSPCHEDFQRLKLASFDKLQVSFTPWPLVKTAWNATYYINCFCSVCFTHPLNVFSDCLEHVAARNYVWHAEMWMMRTTYLNNSCWVELLLKSIKIMQNQKNISCISWITNLVWFLVCCFRQWVDLWKMYECMEFQGLKVTQLQLQGMLRKLFLALMSTGDVVVFFRESCFWI